MELERFLREGSRWPGHWTAPPENWDEQPEGRLVSQETLQEVHEAIATLPPAQQQVIRLRDIDQWSSEEVRNALGLSETNQRVLLHRARSKVRPRPRRVPPW